MASSYDIYDEIGQFGVYQFVICLLLALSMIPTAFSNLNTVFIMGAPEFWCENQLSNVNSSHNSVSSCEYVPDALNESLPTKCSSGFVFDDSEFGSTATTEVFTS